MRQYFCAKEIVKRAGATMAALGLLIMTAVIALCSAVLGFPSYRYWFPFYRYRPVPVTKQRHGDWQSK